RIKQQLAGVAASDRLAPEPMARMNEAYEKRIAAVEAQRDVDSGLGPEDLVYVGLRILATHEGELAFGKLEDGILPRSVADAFIARAARRGDAAKTGGAAEYERAAARSIAFPRSFRLALRLHQRFGIELPLASALAERFERLLLERMMLAELRQFVEE